MNFFLWLIVIVVVIYMISKIMQRAGSDNHATPDSPTPVHPSESSHCSRCGASLPSQDSCCARCSILQDVLAERSPNRPSRTKSSVSRASSDASAQAQPVAEKPCAAMPGIVDVKTAAQATTVTGPANVDLTSIASQRAESAVSFPIYSKVVGVTKEGRQELVKALTAGEALTLKREPANAFDCNAIAVLDSCGKRVAYIRRELARQLAPVMDSNVVIRAEVIKITGGEPGYFYGVNIKIEQEMAQPRSTMPDNTTAPCDSPTSGTASTSRLTSSSPSMATRISAASPQVRHDSGSTMVSFVGAASGRWDLVDLDGNLIAHAGSDVLGYFVRKGVHPTQLTVTLESVMRTGVDIRMTDGTIKIPQYLPFAPTSPYRNPEHPPLRLGSGDKREQPALRTKSRGNVWEDSYWSDWDDDEFVEEASYWSEWGYTVGDSDFSGVTEDLLEQDDSWPW